MCAILRTGGFLKNPPSRMPALTRTLPTVPAPERASASLSATVARSRAGQNHGQRCRSPSNPR
jgi:hypothetical protein